MSATLTTAPAPTVIEDAPAVCGRCQHADEHGWWGDNNITHCRTCHLDWKRTTRQAHCTVCCSHFISPRAFDAHMTANGCTPPETVTDGKGRPRFKTRVIGGTEVLALIFRGTRPNFDDLT